jgi:hypothetical protein
MEQMKTIWAKIRMIFALGVLGKVLRGILDEPLLTPGERGHTFHAAQPRPDRGGLLVEGKHAAGE